MIHMVMHVCVCFQSYNGQCVISDGQPLSGDGGGVAQQQAGEGMGDLYLVPDTTKVHTFTFVPQQADIGHSLEVSAGGVGSCVKLRLLWWGRFGSLDYSLPQFSQ